MGCVSKETVVMLRSVGEGKPLRSLHGDQLTYYQMVVNLIDCSFNIDFIFILLLVHLLLIE